MKVIAYTTIVTVIFVSCLRNEAIKVETGDKALILLMHNYLRSQLPNVTQKASNMLLMKWSDEAAAKAQAWADTCARKHDLNVDRLFGDYTYIGQNYAGSGKSVEFSITYLYSEYPDWNWVLKSCLTGQQCGHFTQIVWHDSEFVGCGVADCSERGGLPLHLFCNYAPMGNYYLQNPYKVGTPCSDCPSTHPYCVANLCSTTPEYWALDGYMNTDGKRECVFPFVYLGQLYHDCASYGYQTWCAEEAIYKSKWHFCKRHEKPCHFPFYYNGKRYDSCLRGYGGKHWCSETSEYSGSWHYCGEPEEE